MKTCPICKSRCFEDMEVCFGCMHHFSADMQHGNSSILPSAQNSIAIPLVEDGASPGVPVINIESKDFSINSNQRNKKSVPQHAAPSQKDVSTDEKSTIVVPGAQAHYQLVISLEPVSQSVHFCS